MKKVKFNNEICEEINTYLIEILYEIKNNNEVFSQKVIEGLYLCLETIVTKASIQNKRNEYYKEFIHNLKKSLLIAINMKQNRGLYKKTKADNVSDFFEISLGTFGQIANNCEIVYFPFIKNANTLEIGVKEYNDNLDEYIVDVKDSYFQSKKNIRI